MLEERLGRGTRAATGVEDLRDVLEQHRVELLLFEERGHFSDPATLESMVEEALAQSTEILPVRHYSDELARRGHVAALLRF